MAESTEKPKPADDEKASAKAQGTPADQPAAASKPAEKPAAADKPKPKPKPRPKVQLAWEPTQMHRRDWMLIFGWISFSLSSLVGLLFYCLRFLFPNVTFEPPLQFKAGPAESYAIGRVDERFKELYGVWMVRNEKGLYALSTVCTHLGCTPNWLENEKKFKCPCHGSGFRQTGVNFEGPAPRPLERYRIGLAADGQVLVDKSMKFQGEKGEWDKPESFLYV